jgi:hypothetical protein
VVLNVCTPNVPALGLVRRSLTSCSAASYVQVVTVPSLRDSPVRWLE